MNRSVWAKTELALRALIQNSLEAQSAEGPWIPKELLSPMSFLKEICQVRLTGPRRSGHTTAALKVCGEMFDNPLYVALGHEMAKCIKNTAERMNIDNFAFTSRRSFKNDTRGRHHDAIIVDPAFDMTPSFYGELFDIGNCFAPSCDKFCIVLVG